MAVIVVAANAGLNYLLMEMCRPVAALRGVHNVRTPYMGVLGMIKTEVYRYL
jgi:hypothetical protein